VRLELDCQRGASWARAQRRRSSRKPNRHTGHTSLVSGLLIGYARVSSDAEDLTARVAPAAGDDPDVLRMGNLDTDIPPSEEAMEATRAASLFTVSPTRGRVTRWRMQQLAAAARIARSRTSSARSV
jgi:hypothetical protein